MYPISRQEILEEGGWYLEADDHLIRHLQMNIPHLSHINKWFHSERDVQSETGKISWHCT